MSFPRYPKYKDSGVEWLGEVPEHWVVHPLKRIVKMRSGEGITSERIEPDGAYPVYGGNGLRGFTDRFTHSGRVVLIGRQGALCGNVNYAEGHFFASEHAVVVEPTRPLSIGWLGELLGAMNLNQYSLAAAQPGLAVELINRLVVPIPSDIEQAAIAAFLKNEAGKIDALVAEQERLIDLLKEKRQAVISHAVTNGLNPDAPMKDSGLEWIGRIPKHWSLVALGYRYEVALGKMLDSKQNTGEHTAPYLRNADVQWGAIRLSDLSEMDFDAEERMRFSLKNGDLLVCEGGEVGRCAVWRGELDECYYQKALHRLRPFRPNEDSTEFCKWVLFAAVHRGCFAADESKATIAHLPAEALRRTRFIFPPRPEQDAIASYLDRGTSRIDALAHAAERAIDLLKERRTAVITAAVTGQIDVRAVGARSAA